MFYFLEHSDQETIKVAASLDFTAADNISHLEPQ
jgi:hypothetical protein